MKVSLSFVLAVGIIILSLIGLREAQGLAFSTPTTAVGGPGTFPVIMLYIMIVLAVCLAISELVKSYKESKNSTDASQPMTVLSLLSIDTKQSLFRVLALVAAMVAYTFVLIPLGFLIATPLFLIVVLWLFGLKKLIYYPIISIAYPIGLFLLFQRLLGISLP